MPWVLAQTAADLLAVHVPVDARELQRLLPAGLVADEWEDSAWVTVLAMEMRDVHPRFVPALPLVSRFGQTGIRSFVRARATGEQGVAFLRLDVSSRLVALVGRLLLGAPYRHAAVAVGAGRVRGALLDATWSVGVPAADTFLGERDTMYSTVFGRLCRTSVEHPPVVFAEATADLDVGSVLGHVGLRPSGQPVVRAAGSLPSHVGVPRRV